MKSNYLIPALLLIATVFTTCKKDDPEERTWLDDWKGSLTNCHCEKSIIQATYEKETVYYIAMTDPLCDGVQNYVLVNKDGKTVRVFSQTEWNALNEAITDRTVIYRCKDKAK